MRRPGYRVIGFYKKQGRTRPVIAASAPRARIPRPTRTQHVSDPEEEQQQGSRLINSETFDVKTGTWIDSSFRIPIHEHDEDKEPPLTPEFQAFKEKLAAREREKEPEEQEEEDVFKGPLPTPKSIGPCPNCGCELKSRWKSGHINCRNCHACMIFMTGKNGGPTTFMGGSG